jgi:5-methylphenazine-1-carboxylate 1-monooxygenase
MKVVIAGAGIGGLTTALALHQAGIGAELFDQAQELRELGVGINMLPHAVKELARLGLLSELDRVGIRTRELILMNRVGQEVWRELRGIDAGYDLPQFSIHRGKLHGLLHRAVLDRLGVGRVHTGHRLVDFEERGEGMVARFERRADGALVDVVGDVLIGADGIHSALRARFYPDRTRDRRPGTASCSGAAQPTGRPTRTGAPW